MARGSGTSRFVGTAKRCRAAAAALPERVTAGGAGAWIALGSHSGGTSAAVAAPVRRGALRMGAGLFLHPVCRAFLGDGCRRAGGDAQAERVFRIMPDSGGAAALDGAPGFSV